MSSGNRTNYPLLRPETVRLGFSASRSRHGGVGRMMPVLRAAITLILSGHAGLAQPDHVKQPAPTQRMFMRPADDAKQRRAVAFIANRGQAPEDVLWVAHGAGFQASFRRDSFVLHVLAPKP